MTLDLEIAFDEVEKEFEENGFPIKRMAFL